jgi:hypothetical protein
MPHLAFEFFEQHPRIADPIAELRRPLIECRLPEWAVHDAHLDAIIELVLAIRANMGAELAKTDTAKLVRRRIIRERVETCVFVAGCRRALVLSDATAVERRSINGLQRAFAAHRIAHRLNSSTHRAWGRGADACSSTEIAI